MKPFIDHFCLDDIHQYQHEQQHRKKLNGEEHQKLFFRLKTNTNISIA